MSARDTQGSRSDRIFTVAEARLDRWRGLLQGARSWEAASQHSKGENGQAAVSNSLQELREWEDYFAYPGAALLRTLSERIASGDATGTDGLISWRTPRR